MKKHFYLIALLAVVLGACGCEKTPQEAPTPVDKTLIKSSVPVTNEWIYSGKPEITIHIENGNSSAVKVEAKIKFTTDKKKAVTTITDSVEIAGNGKIDYVMSPSEPFEPGFYKALCYVNGVSARNFVFGVDPFKIVSAPDMQPDYESFWKAAKDQLAAILRRF